MYETFTVTIVKILACLVLAVIAVVFLILCWQTGTKWGLKTRKHLGMDDEPEDKNRKPEKDRKLDDYHV